MMFQDGTTPLILAAANSHVALVKELLDQGGEPNATRHVSMQLFPYMSFPHFLPIYMYSFLSLSVNSRSKQTNFTNAIYRQADALYRRSSVHVFWSSFRVFRINSAVKGICDV